ncbi:MAG TPA: hypothetical protein VKR59_10030 [Terriglobales bacterium]|nr:hypothetical protein [Terriglobales bacterium]
MSNLPEGWTDDMNIAVPPGHTLDEVVDYVLEGTIRRDSAVIMIQHLKAAFGLSQSDAELALDRVCGGVVRAATGRATNCPAEDKDPLAFVSYQKCLKKPALITAIYPQFAKSRKPWWRRLLS